VSSGFGSLSFRLHNVMCFEVRLSKGIDKVNKINKINN
jgi:hypothetical protein